MIYRSENQEKQPSFFYLLCLLALFHLLISMPASFMDLLCEFALKLCYFDIYVMEGCLKVAMWNMHISCIKF